MQTFTLNFQITRMGRSYVATTKIAGIGVFGHRANDPFEATQSLFRVLSGGTSNDLADIAVSALISNTDFGEDAELLTDGDNQKT